MKTIIMTIKPCYLNAIRNGRKTLEIRKTSPEAPFRVLCCESGSGGKIKAEFICDRVTKVNVFENGTIQHWEYNSLERAQITYEEMAEYIGFGRSGYALHIINMIDYCTTKGQKIRNIGEFGLKRPPQSWQYLRTEEG